MGIEAGMRGTIGPGGHGKSLSVAFRLFRRARRGRRVVANTPCIDLRTKRVLTPNGIMPVPVNVELFGESWASAYITHIDQLPQLAECDVWLDEVWSWMAGHDWENNRKNHGDVFAWFYQDRKDDVIVEWTHRQLDVDVNIRRNTIELSRCSKWGPIVVQIVKDPQEVGGKPRPRLYLINKQTYSLYSTYQNIGDGRRAAPGKALPRSSRRGLRAPYGLPKGTPFQVYRRALPVVDGSEMLVEIPLLPDQSACLIRKFGPAAVSWAHVDDEVGGRRYGRDTGMIFRPEEHYPELYEEVA